MNVLFNRGFFHGYLFQKFRKNGLNLKHLKHSLRDLGERFGISKIWFFKQLSIKKLFLKIFIPLNRFFLFLYRLLYIKTILYGLVRMRLLGHTVLTIIPPLIHIDTAKLLYIILSRFRGRYNV